MSEQGGKTSPGLAKVASVAAQQNAMQRGGKTLSHGSRLFGVEQGWEATTLREDKEVTTVQTLLEFEAALQEPEKKILFIPLGALITDENIEKLCHRNAIVKTLFKEVKKS